MSGLNSLLSPWFFKIFYHWDEILFSTSNFATGYVGIEFQKCSSLKDSFLWFGNGIDVYVSWDSPL